MNILQLIANIGSENIQVQYLDECTVRAQATKAGTHVTFGTTALTPGDLLTGKGKYGIVLWMDRDMTTKIFKENASKK